METTVIKVQYGKTLRRFNLKIDEGQFPNISELRKKIQSLFIFPPDAELILTYLDDDDDVVTLVDDDDLSDMLNQQLDPVRITVTLNDAKRSIQNNNSTASSTPLSSPNLQPSVSNLDAALSKILLGKVPPPFQDPIAKLIDGLLSKAAPSSTAPGIIELITKLSEMSLPCSGQPSDPQPTMSPGVPENLQKPEAFKEKTESAKSTEQSPEASTFDFTPESAAGILKSQNEMSKKSKLASDKPRTEFGSWNKLLFENEKDQKIMAPPADETPTEKGLGKHSGPVAGMNSGSFRASHPTSGGHANDYPGWVGKSPSQIWGPPPALSNYFRSMEPFGCPFSGIGVGESVSAARPQSAFGSVRKDKVKDLNGTIIHAGVVCDGCDTHPITGPRYKSKVKTDFDLCSTCFEKIGDTNEYFRIDQPALPPLHFKALHDNRARHSHQHPHAFRGPKSKMPKLDSRFILDVNIFDGTVMAPLTPFTKIWRMRNSGTLLWPPKTQLVWIGGDKLSDMVSVAVQIPSGGLLMDQELDVAVDFISPEHPGRYVSYWRMASPSGQKFGQRFWVLIQVDASNPDLPREVMNFNLNLPPVGSSLTGAEIINVEPEPMLEDTPPVVVDKPMKAMELGKRDAEQDLKFPINDSLLVGNGASTSIASSSTSPAGYPIIDLTDMGPYLPSGDPATSMYSTADAEKQVEEKLLKELDEMGFKQVNLNKEVLRSNKYDLERSVDDLCEWDPILDELEEMGFNDMEMNKKLLKKNKGSIKLVVMDLIAGEKKD